ncbi:MAG TPA: SMP-30/gluconolactonase/LRE family protein [Methylomirabilota bacterium]
MIVRHGVSWAMAGALATAVLAAQAAQPVVTVRDAGLQTPESVLHDPAADVYLVSNINGSPSEKDNNGFISRVSPEGTVTSLRWIAGGEKGVTLNAPKGLAIVGDTLVVADIDCVRKFNRSSGAPAGEVCIEGASFLNDVAAGDDGAVYVTDTGIRFEASGPVPTGSDAVHRIGADGTATVFVQGKELANPNGLAWTERGLIVVPFGGKEIWRYDAKGSRTTVATAPAGQFDGVVTLPDGGLLVTSWEASAIYRVSPSGEVSTFASGLESPADLGYDAGRRRAALPLFQGNAIAIFEVP